MWVLTHGDRKTLFNLNAYDSVFAQRDRDTGEWAIVATTREGASSITLATTEDPDTADDLVVAIANRLSALDLRGDIDEQHEH
jgi:hypothetical protein